MPVINCEVELILNWSASCVVMYTDVANKVPTFTITRTNLYVPVVTLSTQDNAWSEYLAKPELLAQNANLNHLIESSFQGVNRLFVLAFEDDHQR